MDTVVSEERVALFCSRLVRKGLRFSKTHQVHSIVVGLVINIWFFGRAYIEFMV